MASDWTNIPLELLISVAKRLVSFEDLAEFGVVCSWWRSAVREVKFDYSRPQLPWLTLVDQTNGQDQRTEIFSLVKQRVSLLRSIPRQVYQSRSNLSSRGWILSSDGRRHFLLHPLKGTVFQMPDLECSVQKFVYTEDKSVIITVKIASSTKWLELLWRPEDPVWTRIVMSPSCWDRTSINCQLTFIVDMANEVDYSLSYLKDVKIPLIMYRLRIPPDSGEKWFVAESGGGEIFLVAAKIQGSYHNFRVSGFRVFSLRGGEVERRIQPERMFSLGDRAFFVGNGSSLLFVKASDFAGFCEPDCIYFAITDEISGTYVDAGVFRMKEGKLLHSTKGNFRHTFWVQPTFE